MEKNQGTGSSRCRSCNHPLQQTFVDLGMSPMCESYVSPEQLNAMEPFYPLHAYVCENCFLVQLDEYVSPENIFTEYAYFSSYSDTWLDHVKTYVAMISERLGLTPGSRVMEVASNDGYLLQYFVERNIPVLGVEPAANVARVAQGKGVRTLIEFFGEETARTIVANQGPADLIIGNNVLAQVPDLNDFVAGMRTALKPQGVITVEFPHLQRLMEENQFDTIYHEHFSYFSLLAVEKVFDRQGLKIFDVEELKTHGGSLRLYAGHEGDSSKPTGPRVLELRERERVLGFADLENYSTFAEGVKETKRKLLEFLIGVKRAGKSIAGYGAPGKGNTLLNYCGVRTDFVDYTVDRNPYKQGKFLPGTHIPIFPPDKIDETRPDYLLILPWNFKEEIMEQMAHVRQWGGQFIVPIPQVTVYP
jgi:SAM-dependent methyltransferase